MGFSLKPMMVPLFFIINGSKSETSLTGDPSINNIRGRDYKDRIHGVQEG